MRVLIIAANREHKPDPVVPLGAACVAGAARQAGHHVELFDACFLGDDATARLAAHIRTFQPEVIGLSMRNIDDVCWPRAFSYLPFYKELVDCVRRTAPNAMLVLGGSAYTLMPDRFHEVLKPDYGVVGDGESTFVTLLHDLETGRAHLDGQRILQASRQISFDGRPALDLLDLDEYYRRGGALNVQTSRGCSFKCAYCSYPLLEGRLARRRPVADVVDEIGANLQRHHARHFFVVDNTFNQPAEHAHAFCREIIDRGLDVSWTAYVTPAGMSRELLKDMMDAGCSSVEFGTDAASPATLRALGKSFTVKEVEQVSTWARELGLKFAHSLIFGGPRETPDTFDETVSVMEVLKPTAVFAMLGVRLYPGTSLARQAEREGVLRESEIGLTPSFYISEAIASTLEKRARAVKERNRNWYFPGLEGDRWVRYWKRRRANGVRGPLWEWMGNDPLHVPEVKP